jgi:hypothetical protein
MGDGSGPGPGSGHWLGALARGTDTGPLTQVTGTLVFPAGAGTCCSARGEGGCVSSLTFRVTFA